MRIEVVFHDRFPLAILTIHGKLMMDTNIEDVDRVVEKTLERVTIQGIIVDLHNVPFADHAGFQALLKARNRIRTRGVWFALCCTTKRVHDLLATSRLLDEKVFHVYDTCPNALVAFVSYLSDHPDHP